MSHSIKKCCEKYTLQETCSVCSKKTESPAPPKYSPDDKYASYRRQYKKEHGLE